MNGFAASSFAFAFALSAASVARADDTIKHPGDHPSYVVEIEPHLLVGFDRVGDAAGWGVGGRFSIPIVDNGFVKSINNNVAISFGADILFPGNTAAIDLPVAMQWNFFVHSRWSVFGEPGLVVGTHRDLHALPALWAGARYHFNEHIALTMRIGYPTFSIGLSFW